jgi:hypothetical protein
MNGRVFDPFLARFLSPDPFVQAPDYSQNYNRYSYAFNNPLKYTDPSGEFITWSFNNGGFSIGFNLTPIGIPLGGGINIGWGNGGSLGAYGEVGYRVGRTGFGSGAAVSQSFDYNFNQKGWSTTTSESLYASLGPLNAGVVSTQSYTMDSKKWTNGWGVSAGIGIGNDAYGLGLNVGYGSGGWTYGIGGYLNPEKPTVYKSPVSNNYGDKNGECVLRCLEEFSSSYGMDEYDFNYWLEENGGKLGVNGSNVKGLIDNTGIFRSDNINARERVHAITEAFTNDKRVLMGFKTKSGGEHAVMVSKVKTWSSGRYRVFFSETSPARIAPYTTSNLISVSGARFWTFYKK